MNTSDHDPDMFTRHDGSFDWTAFNAWCDAHLEAIIDDIRVNHADSVVGRELALSEAEGDGPAARLPHVWSTGHLGRSNR
jgi:hypothetical protein